MRYGDYVFGTRADVDRAIRAAEISDAVHEVLSWAVPTETIEALDLAERSGARWVLDPDRDGLIVLRTGAGRVIATVALDAGTVTEAITAAESEVRS